MLRFARKVQLRPDAYFGMNYFLFRHRFFSTQGNQHIRFRLLDSDCDLTEFTSLCLKTFKDTYVDEFSESNLSKMYSPHFTHQQLPIELNSKDITYFLAKDNKKLIGYAKLQYKDSLTILDKIYLLKEYQSMGIGRRLLSQCCHYALQRNQKSMELFAWEKNINAILFYERFGFYTRTKMKKEFGGHEVTGHIMVADDLAVLLERLNRSYSLESSNTPIAKL